MEESESEPLPSSLVELLKKTNPVVKNIFDELPFGEYAPLTEASKVARTYTLGYLLSWNLIIKLISESNQELRPKFGEFIRQENYLDLLVPTLFHLMMIDTRSPSSETILQAFSLPNSLDIRIIAIQLYYGILRHLPALFRQWWNNLSDKRTCGIIEKYTSSSFTSVLWNEEVNSITSTKKSFDNMTIKVRPSVREVVAIYSIDEGSMELVIELPYNFPLGNVKVESGKKVGVGTSQWRNWMLQLLTFLQHQNGSIFDGLAIWKKNVDKKFQGVEECYICFYILHGSNHQVPKLACRTCKKKFHSACLYKWFSTSNNSTCPLCRNLF